MVARFFQNLGCPYHTTARVVSAKNRKNKTIPRFAGGTNGRYIFESTKHVGRKADEIPGIEDDFTIVTF